MPYPPIRKYRHGVLDRSIKNAVLSTTYKQGSERSHFTGVIAHSLFVGVKATTLLLKQSVIMTYYPAH